MTFLLAASLFFTGPAPMEMPRAQAFLVKERANRRERATMRLEDRFDKTDLWISRSVDGMWRDADGREFMLATLGTIAPPLTGDRAVTRSDYVASCAPLQRKDDRELFVAVDKLSPIPPSEEFARPHQTPRGYRDVRYYHGTNETAVICAFNPEKSERWFLATWTLAQGDVFDDCVKLFEYEFLEKRDTWPKGWAEEPKAKKGREKDPPPPDERELLRADARHSVALYDNWRVTDGDEFTVLDDIQNSRAFTVTLTNDLKRMRGAYAAAVPSPIDGSNVLAVARIFASRGEYLDALGQNDHSDMEWSAAYWSPQRRELVAYLPQDGSEKLIETIRHEAFHQYLSYATSMIPTSPWFNEGYAQYFEGGPEGPAAVDSEGLVACAEALPGVMMMDYDEFYAGTDEDRRLKYRIALSIAVFLERGAQKVRFEPFKDVKRDYVKSLIATKDMRQATSIAFKDQDTLDLFVREWTKYWKER
jgi:hypothetical protein